MAERFAKLKEEFFKLLPPTIYFFVTLHIIAIIRVLMVKGTGLPASSTMSIAVASLILGKSVLLADMLPAINLYPREAADLQHCLEVDDLSADVRPHPLPGAALRFLEAGGWDRRRQREAARGNCVAAFLGHPDPAVCVDRGVFHDHELVRYIGRDRAKQIFFGPLPRGPAG